MVRLDFAMMMMMMMMMYIRLAIVIIIWGMPTDNCLQALGIIRIAQSRAILAINLYIVMQADTGL